MIALHSGITSKKNCTMISKNEIFSKAIHAVYACVVVSFVTTPSPVEAQYRQINRQPFPWRQLQASYLDQFNQAQPAPPPKASIADDAQAFWISNSCTYPPQVRHDMRCMLYIGEGVMNKLSIAPFI